MNPNLKTKITTLQAPQRAHIREAATLEDSNAPRDGSSIVAHVSEVKEPGARPTGSIQEILAPHDIDDPIGTKLMHVMYRLISIIAQKL